MTDTTAAAARSGGWKRRQGGGGGDGWLYGRRVHGDAGDQSRSICCSSSKRRPDIVSCFISCTFPVMRRTCRCPSFFFVGICTFCARTPIPPPRPAGETLSRALVIASKRTRMFFGGPTCIHSSIRAFYPFRDVPTQWGSCVCCRESAVNLVLMEHVTSHSYFSPGTRCWYYLVNVRGGMFTALFALTDATKLGIVSPFIRS